MILTISELEKRLIESDEFINAEVNKIEQQRREAYEVYISHRDEAFEGAFEHALNRLNIRGKVVDLSNGDVVKLKKELREISRFVKKGYDSGKLLEQRKEELEEEIEAAKQAKNFKDQPLEIPVRVKRYQDKEYQGHYEVSYPFEGDNSLSQKFSDIFFETLSELALIPESPYKVGDSRKTYIIPTLDNKIAKSQLEEKLNKAISNSRLKKANIRVKIYEENTGSLEREVVKKEAPLFGEPVTAEPLFQEPKPTEQRPNKFMTSEITNMSNSYSYYSLIKKVKKQGIEHEKKGNNYVFTITPENAHIFFKDIDENPSQEQRKILEQRLEKSSGLRQTRKEAPELKPYTVEGVEAYTPNQLKEALNYSDTAPIYKLSREGKLERVEDGEGNKYFTKKSFEDFLERRNLGTRKIDDKLRSRVGKCLIKGMSIDEIAKKLDVKRQSVAISASNQGHYSEDFIKRKYDTLEKVESKKFPGIDYYYGKDEIRRSMLEHISAEHPNPRDLSVLSLEGPNFRSYIELAKQFGVNPEKSVIAEKDDKSYLAMQSITRHKDVIDGGEIFDELTINHGEMIGVVEGLKPGEYKFEAINLDYNGALDSKKINTVRALFLNELIADNALLFMTLNNSPRKRQQLIEGSENLGQEYAQGFGTDDQTKIMNDILDKQTFVHNYDVKLIDSKEYSAKETPMLHLCYSLRRVE